VPMFRCGFVRVYACLVMFAAFPETR
jgi:hypothetical protein